MECTVKGLRLHYEEIGTGRPLLALHGWPGDHRHVFNDIEPIFSTRTGWRRIYPDLPGMGKTPGADWITHEEHMLDIVLDFIDAVAPNERIVVAGTSYGAYLARGVVFRQPARLDGLMLNVPVVIADMSKRNAPKHRVVHEDPSFLAALNPDEQDIAEIVVTQSLSVLEAFRDTFAPAVAVANHKFLERLSENYSFTFDVDALDQPFMAPTLILTGRYDHLCGYKDAYQILENYPRSTFVVLDGAGHALAIEKQAVFQTLVSEWLDRVEGYSPDGAQPSL